ncbi:MAG: hypothetical protein MUE72_11250 [Chitinophagaceae bacterium]|nr:hypothetical protein [Chitinophagaceae bacterium]
MKVHIQLISIFSVFLPILVFLFYSFNRKSKLKWVIFLLLVTSLIVDILSFFLAKKSTSNIGLIHIFTLTEGGFLVYFFYTLLKKHTVTKKIILALASIFFLTWAVRALFFQSFIVYDYFSQTIEFILLLLLCLFYFFQKVKVTDAVFIYNTYEFWLVSALLIYCAGTFFSFFIPMNPNARNADTLVFEHISRLGSIIKNLLITVAFCINPDKLLKKQPNTNSIYYVKDLKE